VKLKAMFGSGIKSLDGLAGELEANSQLTFKDLNSEVSKHSSSIEKVWHFTKLLKLLGNFSLFLYFDRLNLDAAL